MSFVPTEPSGDPSLRQPESEQPTPPGGTPLSAAGGEAQLPVMTQGLEPAPGGGAGFTHAGFSREAPWPFGVADAAAEFAAIQAKLAAAAEPPAVPDELRGVVGDLGSAQSPQYATSVAPSEPVWAASPEPTWPDLQRPEARGFEPNFLPSPEPAASPPPALTEQPAENDAFDRVSIDWVPSDDPSGPIASPAAVATPGPENAGYLERYQRLFASDVVDPERAILAALDAAIQAPASDVPRDEPDALTAPLVLPSSAPVAGIEPGPVVSVSAPVALSEPEPAPWVAPVEPIASTVVAEPELPAEPSSVIAPAPAIEQRVAAAPAVAAVVASSFSAPTAPSEPPPAAANPPSPPADAAPGSQARAKLDVKRDVDWSEDVLARAARAAAAAGERARAQQQAQAAAAGLASQPPGSASVSHGRTASERPGADKARADSSARARSSDGVEAVSSERAARHKARRQQARRARFAATPLFLFAFVGSVMVALGVGFVSGFVVGRETPKAQQASVAPPAPQPAALAPEPAAPVPEAQPAARRKGALTSRVEAIVPAPTPSGQALPAGGPETAGVAPSAAAKLVRGPFDPKSAGAALSKAASRAGVCVPPGDAGGEAVVTITLDPSGVTSNAAVYGARFSGTQAGECIAGLLRDVKVRPFTGEPVTVKKTIQVN